jgi:transcription elongation GreA/GreB family factor
MDKRLLIEELLELLNDELAKITISAKTAARSVGDDENRPESKKDMRSTEASYFARGQAIRVASLEESIKMVKFMDILSFSKSSPIGASAVTGILYENGDVKYYFIVPDAGGRNLTLGNMKITTLAVKSPLGCELIEKKLGDLFEFNIKGNLQELEIIELY